MCKDKKERRHRRTAANPEAKATMASADFGNAPNLSQAMGLEPDIEGLSLDWARIAPVSGQSVQLACDGIEADDFVACCSDELLRAIVRAAGAFFEDEE